MASPPPPVDADWAERHRPQTLKDLVGNPSSLGTMKKWAEAWQDGPPKVRALVLQGPPGVGKTSAAHALARDMGWDVIELNASDARSGGIITRIAGTGSVSTTFSPDGSFRPASEGGRTLIILDEADNLYERGGSAARSGDDDLSDRGGKRAIVQTIRETRQPIILIVNDAYALFKGGGEALRSLAEAVKFQHPQSRSVAKRLADICKAEGVKAHPDALLRIAEEAGGDLRAAVNDLQAAAQGRDVINIDDVKDLGRRDTGRSVFEAMPDIFKTMDLERARRATRDLDENPEHIILWIDENLPEEYKEPADLARGYDRLSKADVYLGRTRRRQYYGLWSYANDLMTGGVALAKAKPYKGWTRWQFPGWLRKMSASRANRQLRDGVARKIAQHTHTSTREARLESLEPITALMKADTEFAVAIGADLELTPEEVAFLLDTKPSTKKVQELAGAIAAELETRPRKTAGIWSDDGDDEEAPAPKGKAKSKAAPKPKGRKKAADEDDDEDEEDAAPQRPRRAAAKNVAEDDEDFDDQALDADDDNDDGSSSTAKPQPGKGQKGLFEF